MAHRAEQTSAELVEELPAYFISDDLEELAGDVIADNVGFRDLSDLKIVHLLRTDQPLDAEDDIDAIVSVVKASPAWHGATEIDLLLWIKKPNWDLWGEKQQRALITHGLSHVLVTEEGKVKKVGHDTEAFVREVKQFGAWHPSLIKLRRGLAEGPEPMQITVSAGGKSVETDSEALEQVAHDPGKVTDLANAARRAREGSDE